MSLAAHEIAKLDRQLAKKGEDAILRGQDAPDDGSQDLTLRVFFRGYKPDELSGGINQGDSEVILSPTGLTVDPARLGGLTVGGRYRTIQVANPVRVGGEVVRWNLWITG